jgi:hypothetical protein
VCKGLACGGVFIKMCVAFEDDPGIASVVVVKIIKLFRSAVVVVVGTIAWLLARGLACNLRCSLLAAITS